MIRLADIRRWLRPWQHWRERRTLYAACPALQQIEFAIRDARQRHKPIRPLERQRTAIMNQMLRGS